MEQIDIVKYPIFNRYPEITHFTTTRNGGISKGNYASCNLSPFSGDEPESVRENTNRLCSLLEISPTQFIFPYQTHSNKVREINPGFFELPPYRQSEYLQGVDALVTSATNVCIGVTTADCVPILFYDPVNKVIAVAHAGWRGTRDRIVVKTVSVLTQCYGTQPSDLVVAFGPSISAKAYNVGIEVIESFEAAGFDSALFSVKHENSFYLDLWEANRLLLFSAGVLPQGIEISGLCTFTEHERFFSARKLGIKSGRMLSGILIRD
jgi:YfiH family protein